VGHESRGLSAGRRRALGAACAMAALFGAASALAPAFWWCAPLAKCPGSAVPGRSRACKQVAAGSMGVGSAMERRMTLGVRGGAVLGLQRGVGGGHVRGSERVLGDCIRCLSGRRQRLPGGELRRCRLTRRATECVASAYSAQGEQGIWHIAPCRA